MSLEEFKKNVCAKSISEVIISGRPLSEKWGFPSFLLNNSKMLENFFGSDVYTIYNNLTEEEKENSIKWFETHGLECTNMYGGELYEDWNDKTIPKRDLEKLKNLHSNIYELVVSNVVKKVYSCYPEDIQKIIIEKFTEDSNTFEEEIKKNA